MMLMTEAPASSLLGGCWILFLWPLDLEMWEGQGTIWGNPRLQEVKRKRKKNLYPIAPNFERIGWAGELLKNNK